jgi:nucleotide-binding universal stress UspA family protein
MKAYKVRFATIVVATDLSGAATTTALRYAQAIARAHQSRLIVVHAIDPVGYAFPDGAPAFAAADVTAREELRKIEEQVASEGIPVHSVMATGVICDRILDAVRDYQADLLVLGTRAKTTIGRAALGTVARQLLAKAECPVLTVSPDAESELDWAGRWRHVLVATDFSAASLSALRCAHGIAHDQLIALHIPECSDARRCGSCLEKLRFQAPLNESHTVPVDHIVQAGDAPTLITKYAEQTGADLVVLGSPGTELAEEDFRTSTVLQVISDVHCPVLCVPASNRAEHFVEVIRETQLEA